MAENEYGPSRALYMNKDS